MENVEVRTASAVVDDIRYDTEVDPLGDLVARAVQLATGRRVHKLEVEVLDDSIRLLGFCATFHCNQIAQTAAMEVAGDLPVDNQIVVW